MPRGRKKGWRKYPAKDTLPQETQEELTVTTPTTQATPIEKEKVMAEKKSTIAPPPDELDKRQGVCPWCNYSNDDESKGPIHTKHADNIVRNTGHKYQCDICGKVWTKDSLGKLWSEALEKGPQWAREIRARELREI